MARRPDPMSQRRTRLKRECRYGQNAAGKWVRSSAFREIDYDPDNPEKLQEFDSFDAAFEFDEQCREDGTGGRNAKFSPQPKNTVPDSQMALVKAMAHATAKDGNKTRVQLAAHSELPFKLRAREGLGRGRVWRRGTFAAPRKRLTQKAPPPESPPTDVQNPIVDKEEDAEGLGRGTFATPRKRLTQKTPPPESPPTDVKRLRRAPETTKMSKAELCRQLAVWKSAYEDEKTAKTYLTGKVRHAEAQLRGEPTILLPEERSRLEGMIDSLNPDDVGRVINVFGQACSDDGAEIGLDLDKLKAPDQRLLYAFVQCLIID